ncbi:YeeE/YedE family protein [Minwuia thermotolerans]|uniref:Mmebrane protein n=1 Tax=Minwuia thermotolerans TaxID=2056226 RepID=A0A2M9G387_9PROT|nr:YeeE/YedE family protein [Minwuia thermotolerans]PJK30182.1 mmebrane protein [Minwuia thermotolerans]
MLDSEWWLPVGGVAVGAIIGAAARHDRFCTLAALERHWYAADSTGVRTWVLAAAFAIVATQALVLGGVIDLSGSFYLTTEFGWTGAILGGLAFGFGMALVGTCGFGALVRLGGGSLRSLIVLVALGLSALAAQRGMLAIVRIHAVDDLAIDLGFAGDQSLGAIASAAAGADLRLPVAVAAAALLFGWVFADPGYRRRTGHILTAALVGLGITVGWAITATVSESAMAPVQIESASFVAPLGDTILHVIAFTGVLPDYGVGLVVGVVLGAALVAWRRHDVRWEACDDARELGRHLMGGALMGVGGVLALGCTIGQGMSAASLLTLSAPVTMASIIIGARLGLAYLLEGSPWRALPFTAEPIAGRARRRN